VLQRGKFLSQWPADERSTNSQWPVVL
jgi:hypothetical protein